MRTSAIFEILRREGMVGPMFGEYQHLSKKYDGDALLEFPPTLSEADIGASLESFRKSYLNTSPSNYFHANTKKEMETC
jgi:hypothetical protein